MARQVAVVVGVANVAGLPPLNAVHPGSAAFAEWAAAQGFEVATHTDESAPVEVRDVFKTVRAAVDAGDVERLFVFFSGHGMETGAGDDLWLLSDAASSGGEAVNVAKSVALARHCGIPHVAFFADACRTPITQGFDGLVGAPVFPQTKVPGVRVQLDAFYATISGDPSYEPKDGPRLFGLFTDCLLAALRGSERDVLTEVAHGKESHAVLADPLADHLLEKVRLRSAAEVQVTQTPDVIPGSRWEPNVLSWVPLTMDGAPPADREGVVGGGGPQGVGDGAADPEGPPRRRLRSDAVVGPPVLPGLPDVPRGADRPRAVAGMPDAADRVALRASIAERIAGQPGRSHFETAIGATVVGAAIAEAYVDGAERPVFAEDGNDHVRADGDRPLTFLARVEGAFAGWVASLLVPGYVTTVSVGKHGAEHVALVAIRDDAERDRLVLAEAAAAARTGRRLFAEEGDAGALLDAANPTMAVLAAYDYDRLGREDDVRRIAERCRAMLSFVPYDVALLLDDPPGEVRPAFPLMTRGWALADEPAEGAAAFRAARAALAPAPWTSFRALDPQTAHDLGMR